MQQEVKLLLSTAISGEEELALGRVVGLQLNTCYFIGSPEGLIHKVAGNVITDCSYMQRALL